MASSSRSRWPAARREQAKALALGALLLLATACGRREQKQTVVITPAEGTSAQDIATVMSAVGAKQAQLGNGKELWSLPMSQTSEVADMLGDRARDVEPVGDVTAGEVFQPTGNADLTPEQEALVKLYRERATTANLRVAQIPLAVAGDMLRYGLVPEAAPEGPRTLTLALQGQDSHVPFATKDVGLVSDDTFSWMGAPLEGPGDATFVVTPSGITGTVTRGDELYSIRPLGGGLHAIIKVDARKFPVDEPATEQPFADAPPSTRPSRSPSPRADAAPCPSDDPKRLDVLIAYTKAAAARVGGEEALVKGIIPLAEAETNKSYVESKVAGRIRVVRVLPVAYRESGSVKSDLDALVSGSDGSLNVHDELAKAGADAAVLIVGKADACGYAGAILAQGAEEAAAVVLEDCATGYYSLAHELGHLFGARHDVCVDKAEHPFKFGHGHTNGRKWRTIMAYDQCCGGCRRVIRWASPDVRWEGEPTGVAGISEDVRVLNTTFRQLARFRCPLASP
jgi:hypothetical protein